MYPGTFNNTNNTSRQTLTGGKKIMRNTYS